MALPVIDDVFRCAIRQTVSGKNAVNVIHVFAPGSPSSAAVAAAVAKAWGDDAGPCLLQATGVTLDGVDVTALDGVSPSVSGTFGLADNQTGQHSAFTMPAGDAMCVALKTDTRGRRANGRLFLAGLCSNQMETNQQAWLGATASAAVTAFGVFATVLDDEITGALHVVATYGENPDTEETWTPAAYPILTYSPSTSVASQRRRDR